MSFIMSIRAIGCVKRAGAIFQRRSFTYFTIPRAVLVLPQLGVLQPRSFGPSRLLSSTSKLFERAEGLVDQWIDDGVPNVAKWNELMDKLAEQSKTDASVIELWADLLEDGVAAKLPDIEITLMRHREISQNLEDYMEAVLAEDEEDILDEEFDDDDDDEDSLSDEEIERIMEEDEEKELTEEEIEFLTKEREEKQRRQEAGTLEAEGRVLEEDGEEHKPEDVAHEELAKESERQQGNDKKNNAGDRS
jgi:hypothetical protein